MPPPLNEEDLFGEKRARPKAKPPGKLAARFILPPFSVLNAREGAWQSRKRAWILLGIQSELGRGGNLLSISDSCEEYRQSAGDYQKHNASLKGGLTYGLTQNPYGDEEEHRARVQARQDRDAEALLPSTVRKPVPGHDRVQGPSQPGLTHHLTCGAYTNRGGEVSAADCGTSIFDPVLTELMYTWFSPPSGQIVDPFAGGSVRGIVAGVLGRDYWGCDLSRDQIKANRIQAEEIDACVRTPRWVIGDSAEKLDAAPDADLIFSCPPYGDLEEYSKDPRDLSTMEYDDFMHAYTNIINEACKRLTDNRFACFVVGDFRGPDGAYRNFPADTTQAFLKAGLKLHNEFILVTAVGSLSIRTEKQFRNSRKAGKTHQQALVYVKGDPVKATRACDEVES